MQVKKKRRDGDGSEEIKKGMTEKNGRIYKQMRRKNVEEMKLQVGKVQHGIGGEEIEMEA